jgi:hypothetical protein
VAEIDQALVSQVSGGDARHGGSRNRLARIAELASRLTVLDEEIAQCPD